MTPRRLLARSLLHFRAVHLAVAAGVAVGAAILAGALMVGSSVRGSLRDLTLDRLGAIDFAAAGERYFRASVSDSLGEAGAAVTAILIRGSAEHAGTGARASKVQIHGVGPDFWGFHDVEPPEIGRRGIAVNRRLADELGAVEGDDLLLRFQADTLVPAESVLGRKADNVRLVRLRITAVLADRGPGRFGLSPRQQLPANAFLDREALQRALEQPDRANAVFLAGNSLEAGNTAWREAFSPEDARLVTRVLPGEGRFLVESERVVLDPAAVEAIHAAASEVGLASGEVLTYLANSIAANGRQVPYSTVTALQEWPDSLRLRDGERISDLESGDIILNEWAAADLAAGTGDVVTLSYYVVGPGSSLETASQEFRVAGVARMAGAALDRDYAPSYKGMSEKGRMSDWNPPFPMDLRLIRPRDEEYWDRYRAAPKAFVRMSEAKDLWTSRFGQITSVRLQAKPGAPMEPAMEAFRAALALELDPGDFGLSLQPVKQAGLAASAGATDFSGLFVGFSMFLIASAAILVALLFRLGVELRAREIGTLLATGQSPRFVRRMLLAEGAALASAGCLFGIPGGVAYAALMLHGLSSWWSGAVGGSFLELHVQWQDLLTGVLCALALMLGSIWLSLRRLVRLSPHALLAGQVEEVARGARRERRARRLRRLAAACALLAVGLLGLSMGAGATARLGAFFGAGTLCLAAALIGFRAALIAPRRGAGAFSGIARLGARNGGRNPTRSVLCAALVACASFMIVTVAMNRHDVSSQEPAFDSGDGGFRLMAEADVPLFGDRIKEVADRQEEMNIFPLRVRAGEDASCLNLYQPTTPTLVGVPPALTERGGFAFQRTLAESEEEHGNPWRLLAREFDGAIPVFADANSATWILHLQVGDELVVEDGSGNDRRLVLAGILSRSIFQSELLLAEEPFLDLFGDHSGFQALLIDTGSDEAATVLEAAFADEGLDATRTSDRLAGFLVVENTYLSTFLTLGGLGLLLGTLGLAVVMVRSALERRGELALLEALGFSKGSIARLIFAENSLLLVFGVVAGTVAAVLAVTPHLASGAADPPWAPLLATLCAIVGTGLLAGAAAATLSLRPPLLASLRRD